MKSQNPRIINVIMNVAINKESSFHTNSYYSKFLTLIVWAKHKIVKLAILNNKIYEITRLLDGGRFVLIVGKKAT